MKVAIVGAGMAGLAAAEALVAAGAAVTLFDKGRSAGGRMSSRRVDTARGPAAFDHGAQYFTVRDPAFAERVARWEAAGLAAPWPAAGAGAFVGMPAMNAPLKDMAARLDIRWSTRIEALERGDGGWTCRWEEGEAGGFDAALVAIPAEQAGALVAAHDPAMGLAADAARADPCWTLMATFTEPLPVTEDIVRDAGAIAWACRDSAKPGRGGPESWVVQAGTGWSVRHLEETPEAACRALLLEFAARIGAEHADVLSATAHRWRYARYDKGPGAPLWRPDIGLGLAGDWLIGPRVEGAFLSGHRLAERLAADPPRGAGKA